MAPAGDVIHYNEAVPDETLAQGGDESEGTRTGAQAVERALAVLTCFLEGPDELRLTDLANRTGLRLSTAHRMVRALCAQGFLVQDEFTERYRLGRMMALLGERARAAMGLDAMRPVIDTVSETTGETAAVGIRVDDDVLVVLGHTSPQALRFDHGVGARVPLYASAMGKALLAFGPRSPRDAVASLGPLVAFTGKTLASPEALLADLELIRRRDYAVNHEERYTGVSGVAVPVFPAVVGAERVAIAAVAVQGPTVRIKQAGITPLVNVLRRAASELGGSEALARLAR